MDSTHLPTVPIPTMSKADAEESMRVVRGLLDRARIVLDDVYRERGHLSLKYPSWETMTLTELGAAVRPLWVMLSAHTMAVTLFTHESASPRPGKPSEPARGVSHPVDTSSAPTCAHVPTGGPGGHPVFATVPRDQGEKKTQIIAAKPTDPLDRTLGGQLAPAKSRPGPYPAALAEIRKLVDGLRLQHPCLGHMGFSADRALDEYARVIFGPPPA